MKICRKCNQEKTPDEFPRDKNRPDGRFPYCKPCHSSKERKERTPEQRAAAKLRGREKRLANTELQERYQIYNFEYALRARYGLEPDEYLRMIEAQDGKCAICLEVLMHNGERTPFRVDHDHKTGKVRELLCNGCNTGLGYFKEDPTRMLSAISYLAKHGQAVL